MIVIGDTVKTENGEGVVVNFEIFETLLRQVNALIILFGQVHESWVRERLCVAVQLCITNKLPIQIFSIYLAPPEKENIQSIFNYGFFQIELIDNSKSHIPDIDILDSALRKMRIGA